MVWIARAREQRGGCEKADAGNVLGAIYCGHLIGDHTELALNGGDPLLQITDFVEQCQRTRLYQRRNRFVVDGFWLQPQCCDRAE